MKVPSPPSGVITTLHLLMFVAEAVGFHKFPLSTQLQSSLPTAGLLNVYAMRLAAQETRARSVQTV